MIHAATLTFVSAKEEPFLPPELAELSDEEADFLQRHVDDLRDHADSPDALRSQFEPGSNTQELFENLLKAEGTEVPSLAEVVVTRLVSQMRSTTTPKAGILAVVTSGPEEGPNSVSVLKLEAIHEAAKFERLAKGRIRLEVLRDLLPGPGALQKGVSWPDPRETSDATVQDTNISAARYFFNAVQLMLSPKPAQAEKALAETIVEEVPQEQLSKVLAAAASQSGPGEKVVDAIRQTFSGFKGERRELTGGDGKVAGIVRPGRIASKRLKISGDGIDIVVPFDRLDQVTEDETGGQWIYTVRMNARPTRGVT